MKFARCPLCAEEGIDGWLHLVGQQQRTTDIEWSSHQDERGRIHDHDPNQYTSFAECRRGHRVPLNCYKACWCRWRRKKDFGQVEPDGSRITLDPGGSEEAKFLALQWHWFNAEAIYQASVELRPGADGTRREVDDWMRLQCAFAGLLYVVVEGYQKLRGDSDAVDALLDQEQLLARLKHFRNATFHYVDTVFDPRVMGFLAAENSGYWLRDLHQALGDFLSERVPDIYEDKH